MSPRAESFNRATPCSTVIRCHPPCIGFNWFGCCQAAMTCYLRIDPPGADEDDVMTLSACLSWPLLWPKIQIRWGAGTPPQRQHHQSCRRQAMARPPQRYRTCRTCIWHRIWTCIGHRILTMTTTAMVHLPTSISTLPNMGTMTNSWGLLLKNPTLQKTIAI